jgi:hypothetical protein
MKYLNNMFTKKQQAEMKGLMLLLYRIPFPNMCGNDAGGSSI